VNYINSNVRTIKYIRMLPYIDSQSKFEIVNGRYRIYPYGDNNNYGIVSSVKLPRNVWIHYKTYINSGWDTDQVFLITKDKISSHYVNIGKYGLAIWLGDESDSNQHKVSVVYETDGNQYGNCVKCVSGYYLKEYEAQSVDVYFGRTLILYINNQKVFEIDNPAEYESFYFYILMNIGSDTPGYFDVWDVYVELPIRNIV